MVLTAARSPARSSLATLADEVDVAKSAIWTVPAGADEGPHGSTGSPCPMRCLADSVSSEGVGQSRTGRPWCFPSGMKQGRPLSDMALTTVAADARAWPIRATVPHGFRSSVPRPGASENTSAPRRHVVSDARPSLAHNLGGSSTCRQAYARTDLLEVRQAADGGEWAEFLASDPCGSLTLRG